MTNIEFAELIFPIIGWLAIVYYFFREESSHSGLYNMFLKGVVLIVGLMLLGTLVGVFDIF